MNVRRLTINVDMDGVIYDFNGHVTALGEVYLGRKLPVTKTWDMAAAWGLTDDEWYELFHRAIMEDGLFRDGLAIEKAVPALHLLSRQHRVRIVTSKQLRYPPSTLAAQSQALHWLDEHGLLNHVEVAFTGNKQGYSADIIVDDKPTLKWAQTGAMNLLFDQPWNQEITGRPPHDAAQVRRVVGWDEVLKWVHWNASAGLLTMETPTEVFV